MSDNQHQIEEPTKLIDELNKALRDAGYNSRVNETSTCSSFANYHEDEFDLYVISVVQLAMRRLLGRRLGRR